MMSVRTGTMVLPLALAMFLAGCAPDAAMPSADHLGASPSSVPTGDELSSSRAIPSLDTAARDRVHDACVAADQAYAARGSTATISAGFRLEAAAEQGGRWVLLYGDGARFVVCIQRTSELTGAGGDFSISAPEPWAGDTPGAVFRNCTNWAQYEVFYCVGQTDAAAVEVIVDNPPDRTVTAIPGPSGHFVVTFPYEGSIRNDGRLGQRLQVSFFDACGHQFLPVMMSSGTPCPRPS